MEGRPQEVNALLTIQYQGSRRQHSSLLIGWQGQARRASASPRSRDFHPTCSPCPLRNDVTIWSPYYRNEGLCPTPLRAEDLQRSGIFRHRFVSSPPLINIPNHLCLSVWTQGYFIRWVIILHDFISLQLWSYLPLSGPLLSLWYSLTVTGFCVCLNTSLLLGHKTLHTRSAHTLCPSPSVSRSSKEPCVLLMEKRIRNQDLGAAFALGIHF